MDDMYKWIILSMHLNTKAELDVLAQKYKDISDTEMKLIVPEADDIIRSLENPPVDGVSVLCYSHDNYPEKLRLLKNPPPVLYVRGDASVLTSAPCVAVVGSRNASVYGMNVTTDFCRDFCEAGFTVISGGARGIDSAAAETTVKFGGKTVVVLGCGIDINYPLENRRLFEKIVESGGALVSEYPFGVKPMSGFFPKRNRIIASLADGCVVIEAGIHSGSLITANIAYDLRKPLFAVPGNITSRGSMGTNHLIRTGAYTAISGMQVAAEIKVMLSFENKQTSKKAKFAPLMLVKKSSSKPKCEARKKKAEPAAPSKDSALPDLSDNEKKIIAAIKNGKASLGEIAEETGLEALLSPTVVMLELKGLIKKEYGEKYTLLKQ